MTDLELAQACHDTYHFPPTLPVPNTGVDVRVTKATADILTGYDGTLIVAFRGSATIEDWLRDFLFAPIVDRAHPQLGPCHAGFLDAAESIGGAIASAVADCPFFLTGHSLGGALALGVGALLHCGVNKFPKAIVTFGAPRFGMAPFVKALMPYAVRQYRRGNDIVPDVPHDVPPDLEFLNARDPLIPIGIARRDFLACHSVDGYLADVATYEMAAT